MRISPASFAVNSVRRRPGDPQAAVSGGIAFGQNYAHRSMVFSRKYKLLALQGYVVGQTSCDMSLKVQAVDIVPLPEFITAVEGHALAFFVQKRHITHILCQSEIQFTGIDRHHDLCLSLAKNVGSAVELCPAGDHADDGQGDQSRCARFDDWIVHRLT